MTDAVRLGRRLADLRRARDAAARAGPSAAPAPGSADPRVPAVEADAVRAELARRTEGLARRLAEAVDGEWIRGAAGGYVRVERPSVALPVDRERLGGLPDSAPADVPLVCLDTETTGLATGTGTVAFLVGVGTWVGIASSRSSCSCPTTPRSRPSSMRWRT